MPYKDESAFLRLRLPKGINRHTKFKKLAENKGLTLSEATAEAVDMWNEHAENTAK